MTVGTMTRTPVANPRKAAVERSLQCQVSSDAALGVAARQVAGTWNS